MPIWVDRNLSDRKQDSLHRFLVPLTPKEHTGRPNIVTSDLLKVTAEGLEGELIGRQSTAELTRRYQVFSRDEIRYRLPNGENLHDISTRV